MRITTCLLAGLVGLVTLPSAAAREDDPRSGHVIVANQQSGSVSLIDLATDTAKIIQVGAGPHEAVISPSGRTAIVTIYGAGGAPGNGLAVIDVARAEVIKTISLGEYTRPHGAWFLPGDETRVVVTSEATRNLVRVNIATGTVEGAIPTDAAVSHMVAVTANGSHAYTANIGGGSVTAIDLKANTAKVIAVAPQVEGIAVTPDGKTVWAGSNAQGTVSLIDTATGAITKTLSGFSLPYRIAMSADGRLAIICDPKGDRLHVADVATQEVIWTLDGIGSPRGVNIAPDGKSAFVTLAADDSMGVIDLEKRALTRKVKVERSPDGIWFGPALRRE